MKLLSKTEEYSLLSVRMHSGMAYGALVRSHLEDATETDWTIGVIYQTLDRLARNGLLSTRVGDPTPQRGGRRKRYYSLTKKGLKALALNREIQEILWLDLSDMGLSIPPLDEIR